MGREDDIRRVLAEILHQGLLSIRSASFEHDTAACYVEADHLHNLPYLIADFREELLTFYCDTERPAYTNAGGHSELYAELWQRLDALRAANRSA